MNPYGQQGQFPFMYPGMYSPGQMAGANNPELSQLITMFAGPLLGQMAGPGNFVPHMMPSMQITDQFAARNYQNQTRQTAAGSFFNQDNTDRVSKLFLAGRSAVTNEPASELNKEQARNMAGFVNNPLAKMALSGLIGADATEGLLHGSKGDISALGNTLNKIGYFRPSATGESRMNARALDDYTRGTYAHLYEPQGNIEDLEQRSRDKDEPVRTAGRAQLKKAAQAEQMTVIEDDDVSQRLQDMEDAPKKVDALYKKYVSGGKATDIKAQAKELTKIENALKDADVLKENETTVGGLVEKAKRVPVNEMHGFMAGQVSQITDNMFQRGMLPQSIGALSAADRVKAIHGTAIDDETMLRLSRETAKRDLGDHENKSDDAKKYRELRTDRERDEFVNSKAGDYRKTLDETRKEIEKTATGATGAKSATDLEKMKGFDALAGNTDSSRSADAIKKYTSAVAAVRDIFGDNGNPNAPLPALLAALEGLTGGAVGSMKPQKIASTLRQMQTLAKEAGVGFEQMAAMSSQIDAQGQMMGLTSADTMRLKPAALAAVKVMQDTGAFSNPVYGQMDKGTATAKTAEMITRGAASKNSRAMAALESIYKADPSRFAGSDMERALAAYRNNEGDGTYTTKSGEKRNIREEIGKGGSDAAARILTQNGGTMDEFTAQINNPAAKEHMNEMFGFLTQKYEQVQHINYGDTRGRVAERLKGTSVMSGKTKQEQNKISADLGEALATMIVDTSDMKSDEQITHIQENIEAKFVDALSKTMPRAEAEKQAKEAAAAISSRSDLNTAIGGANTVYAARSGGEMLSSNAQIRGSGRDAKIAAETANSKKRADRRAATAMGYESNPAARGSDYMIGIAERGENFTLTGLLRAIGQEGSDRELISKYAPDMEAGLKTLDVMRRDALVTKTSVADMANKNDIAGLKKLANVADDVKVVAAADAEKMRDAQIKAATGGTGNVEKDNQALAKTYNQYVTGAKINAADITDQKRAEMMQELRSNKKFMRDMELDALGSGQTTKEILVEKSHEAIGQAKEGQEQRAADVNKVERAMLDGRNADALREGVFATYRLAGASLTDEQAEEIHAAVADSTPEGKEKLKTALDKVSVPEKSKKIMQEVLGATQAGIGLDVGRTFGIEHMPDKELVKELTNKYEAEGVPAPEAAKKAQEEATAAAASKQREEAAGKGVTQKPDKVEISAQTVVIKADKIEGGGGGKDGVPVSAAQPMPNTIAGVAEEMDALSQKMMPTSMVGYMLGHGSSYFPDPADKERFAALSKRKQELAAQPAAEGPQADAPLVPAKPEDAPAAAATEPEKVKQANEEQLKQAAGSIEPGSAGVSTPRPAAPQEKKTAYDLTGADIVAALGGADAIRGSEEKQQELLQSNGLRKNIKAIKEARERGDTVKEENALAPFEAGMRDAVSSGLIPRPVDEDGDPIADFESDEAIAAAEKHLEKYLPKSEETAAPTAAAAAAATTEPEKVKQANEEQLKQSTGATDQPAPPTTEPAVAADEPVPPSMLDSVNEAIQSPAGQAVLTGASALYNKYAPDFIKGAVKKALPRYMEKDDRAEHIDRKDDSGLAEYAAKSETAPFDELGYELGVAINSKDELKTTSTTSDTGSTRDKEFSQRIESTTPAEVTGSPIEQIMYALSKGEMPAQTFTKGSMAAVQNVIENDKLKVKGRMVPLPEEFKDDAAKYADNKNEQEKVRAANDENLQKQNGGALSSTNLSSDDVAAFTAAPLSSLQQPNLAGGRESGGDAGGRRPVQELPASYVAKQSDGLRAASSGGNQSQNLTVNGTLTLSGLQEAILNSRGSQVVQTDGGGAPVVLDPSMTAKTNAGPKTYG